MAGPDVLILTAVVPEANAVADALGVARPAPRRPTRASVQGIRIELHVIGIAARDLNDVRPESPPGVVVMAGLGGALDPSLAVADGVVEGLPAGWQMPRGCRPGTFHTADQIIATPAQKADLFARTGASAVEMENAAVRPWAHLRGGGVTRFVAVRTVSDRADQSLDPAVLPMIDSFGRARPIRVLTALLKRPKLVPRLVRLGADSRRAARRLGEAVRELVGAAGGGRGAA